jgi:phosphoglucosamine mutase
MIAINALVRGDANVVATQMTNLGTERFLAGEGVVLHRVQVGDRYVHEKLLGEGWRLGGEQSGHVLFLDKAPTGDGILTALQTLAACRASGVPLEAWMDRIPSFPQTLINVAVPHGAKALLAGDPGVLAAVADAEADLGADGRVNVRPSGTEPLVRVMVEAASDELVARWSGHVADAVRRAAAQGAEAPTATPPTSGAGANEARPS